jgi:hypothetical protein
VIYLLGRAYWKQQRKTRNAERRRLAASRGWRFAPSDPTLFARWHGGPFAKDGDMRETAGVVRGEAAGVSFTAFDIRIRTKIEITNFIWREEEWYTRTIWVMHLPAALPPIECERARLVQKMSDRVLGKKPVRTGDEAFDGRFVFYSSSPEFVVALLTPELRRWLRQHKITGWWLSGSDLLFTKETWFRVRSGQLVTVAEELAEMVAHFPSGIWEQYGPGRARTR